MPRYRAKQFCFVDGAKRRPGETFVTEAPFNDAAWEKVDEAAPVAAPEPVKAAGKHASKAKAADGDAFDQMDEERLRNFIATKQGKQPKPGTSPETIRIVARELAGTDGVNT